MEWGCQVRFFFYNERRKAHNNRMSWIDDREQQYRTRQAGEDAKNQLQLHKADVVKAKARPTLDHLVEVVKAQVAEFLEKAKDEPDRRVDFTAKPSGGFKLSRLSYPSVELECALNGAMLKVTQVYCPMQDAKPALTESYLRFEVDESDNVVIADHRNGKGFTSLENVSRFLIEPVLYPKAHY